MRCHSPYFSTHNGAYACGRCAACLSSRRRTWAGRLILESYSHPQRSIFTTLTYDREVSSVSIRDCQLFIKKLRKRVGKLRTFYVGEYGDHTQRPHYHAILFGISECLGGPVRKLNSGFVCVCPTCSLIRETWGHGFTSVGNFSERRAMYIAGYVLKKMTHRLDPRLEGREPEFARMSLNPGIGRLSLGQLTAVLRQYGRVVPGGYQLGGRLLPLGRYLRRQIARDLSHGNEEAEKRILGIADTVSKSQKAMRILRAYAWSIQEPVDKVWLQVLDKEAQSLVIPDFPTIHTGKTVERNV
jgi:hypothetical protein